MYRRNNLPEDGRKVRQRKDLVLEIDSSGDCCNHKNATKKDCYYYMQCCVYQIANLAREKGLRKDMLPLFAILLGNDYVHLSIFKKFYMNVSMKQTGKNNTKQGKRIVALLRWLQHETRASAIDKIINHVEKDKKEWLREQIDNGISGYVNEKSMAYDFFGLENAAEGVSIVTTVCDAVATSPVCDEITEIEGEVEQLSTNESEESSESDSEQSDTDDDTEEVDGESPLDLDIQTKQQTSFKSFKPPEWLADKILCGKLPRYVVDLITLRLYINTPQVCIAVKYKFIFIIIFFLHHSLKFFFQIIFL